jgi:hypothetical protein
MHDDPDTTLDCAPAVAELADELLRLGGSLTLIFDHMARSAAAVPEDPDPAPHVLRQLLRDVLERELDDRPPHEIVACAALLGQATDTINRDLYLVEAAPPSPPAGAGRRAPGRRPRGRRGRRGPR